MTLEQIIDIADANYMDGLVRLYFDEPDGQHGDTLAKFIAIELAETFEPDATNTTQLYEAVRVMTQAAAMLKQVAHGFESTGDGHEPELGSDEV